MTFVRRSTRGVAPYLPLALPLIVAAALMQPIAIQATPKAPKLLDVHRFTMSNGLRVVVQPDHRAPVIALGIMVDVGSRNEVKGRSGLAHFFEHMMFQGSKHVGKMEHFTGLESVGADLNANTSSDRTYYYEVMPKNAIELALWMESDRFAHLKINQSNVENQRQTVMEERRQRYDNRPYSASQLKLMRMVFSTWALQHSTIGSMKDLKKAPLSAFESFWRTWYTPNNCVLVIVGDITVPHARALLDKTMGRVERRADPQHRKHDEAPPKAHNYATYNEPLGKMPAFHLAYRVPDRTHPHSWAIEVLAEVLDGGEASRLSRKLTHETGLATRFWAGKHGRRDADVFQIAVEVSQAKPAAVARAKRLIRDALYDIATYGVTPEELRRAKVGLTSDYVFRNLSLSARANLLAKYETYHGDATLMNKALGQWRAVTTQDVQAVAKEWFHWDREIELDVLPKGYAPPRDGGKKPSYVRAWEKRMARQEARKSRAAARAATAKAQLEADQARRKAAEETRKQRKAAAAAKRAAKQAKEAAKQAKDAASKKPSAPPAGDKTAEVKAPAPSPVDEPDAPPPEPDAPEPEPPAAPPEPATASAARGDK